MIKDLQDAIKHAREKAEELRERAYSDFDSWTDRGKALATECLECAAEHDQLADLLTELAERREADRWIPVSERLPNRNGVYWAEFEGGYRCSNCDDIEVYTPNFCPNCGADMRGE